MSIPSIIPRLYSLQHLTAQQIPEEAAKAELQAGYLPELVQDRVACASIARTFLSMATEASFQPLPDEAFQPQIDESISALLKSTLLPNLLIEKRPEDDHPELVRFIPKGEASFESARSITAALFDNTPSPSPQQINSLLVVATLFHDFELFKQLVAENQANPTAYGRMLLQVAAAVGADTIIEHLLGLRKLLVNANQEPQMQAPLFSPDDIDEALCCAVRNNQVTTADLLLKEHGADVHIDEEYLLRRAAELGYLEMVQTLINHGANLFAEDDDALFRAKEAGHKEVVKYFATRYNNRQLLFTMLDGSTGSSVWAVKELGRRVFQNVFTRRAS